MEVCSRTFRRLIESQQPIWKFSRWCCLFALSIGAIKTLLDSFAALKSPLVFRKDFLQDYLIALAQLDGQLVYQPINKLAARFVETQGLDLFYHPTPHPPSLLPYLLPFGLTSYSVAAAIWLLLELLCLLLIARHLQTILSLSLKSMGVVFLFLLCARPIYVELVLGQIGLLLAVLVCRLLSSIEHGRSTEAGVLLGLSMSIKFFGAPILLYLLLKRQWRTLFASAAVFLSSCAAFIGLQDFNSFLGYFTQVVPRVSQLYRLDEHNQSLWTIGTRLFQGLQPGGQITITAPPLVHAPEIATVVSGILISVILLGLYLKTKKDDLFVGVCCVAAIAPIVSPVAWVHGMLVQLAVLPYLLRRCRLIDARNGTYCALFVLCLFMFLGDELRNALIGERYHVSFIEGWVSAIPMITMIAFTFLATQILTERGEAKVT